MIFSTFVFALHDKRVVAASPVNELENWSKWMQPIPDNIPLARISIPEHMIVVRSNYKIH